jgi:hypothetical protein
MANADSGDASSAAAEVYSLLIDELLGCPFPDARYRDGAGWGGPGHHVRILRASQDFWDDEGREAAREAEVGLQADLDALAAMLTARWGEPLTVDLWQHLRAGLEGGVVPEPVNSLCQLAGSMQVWPHPASGRWLALTIGQGDKELPLELLAAVGETPALGSATAGR